MKDLIKNWIIGTILGIVCTSGIFFAISVPAAPKTAITPEAVFETNLVYLDIGGGYGSGLFIDERTIVTAYHVACDKPLNRVWNRDFSMNWEADAIICRPDTDVAIVRTYWPHPDAYTVPVKKPEFLDDFHFMGFGLRNLTYKSGKFTEYTDGVGVELAIRTGLNVHPGDSGGPLLNNKGHLTGIMYGTMFYQIQSRWNIVEIPVHSTALAIPGLSIQDALRDYKEIFNARKETRKAGVRHRSRWVS